MIAEAVKHMLAAGMPHDAIVAAIRDMEASIVPTRTKGAIRQERYRERHNASQSVTCDDSDADTPSLDKSPQTPKINPNPAHNTHARKGTRLSEDFELPDDWRAFAIAERKWTDAEVTAEASQFHDYWRAKPGKDGTKLDWPATWRNWVRSSRRASPRPAASGFAREGPAPGNAELYRQAARYAQGPN